MIVFTQNQSTGSGRWIFLVVCAGVNTLATHFD